MDQKKFKTNKLITKITNKIINNCIYLKLFNIKY